MSVKAQGVHQVTPTDAEVLDWRKHHPRQARPYRVACDDCGKRMWLSGIGLGAHRRACKGKEHTS